MHLYKEYRDVVGLFAYVVETDREVLPHQPCGPAGEER